MTCNATLYPFQAEAVDKMVERKNLLLALVMGAGKSVTSIAAVEELFDRGEAHRCLVIVPAPLKYQWQREIRRFTGRLALVIDGTPKQRKLLYEVADQYAYVIVNYEMVVRELKEVALMLCDAVILDEATAIKSFRAKRSKAIKALCKRIPARYALTGQPIENRPEDLFSIMEAVDPNVLGNFEVFDRTFIDRDWYGRPQRYRNLPLLRKRMELAMVRKTRADIQDQLPKVIENVIPVQFSPAEARLYNEIASRLLDKLLDVQGIVGSSFDLFAHYGGDGDSATMRAQGEIMSRLLALRLVCDDSQLLLHSAELFVDEKATQGSLFASQLKAEGLLDKLPDSSKHKALNELLESLLEIPENKVVVFSTFKGALRRMQDDLAHLGVRSVQYTGDMNARQKDAAKQQFKTDPDTRVFLSSDAGGYGVDIPEANYLISFDLPWSTGKYEQRESRIIRLSSEWTHVNIISMIVEGSVERRIHDLLASKKGVADAFLDGGYDRKGRFELSLSSLTQFLQESKV